MKWHSAWDSRPINTLELIFEFIAALVLGIILVFFVLPFALLFEKIIRPPLERREKKKVDRMRLQLTVKYIEIEKEKINRFFR